jgi:hypothetical protein
MSPKDQTEDNKSDKETDISKQANNPSAEQIDSTFGQQLDLDLDSNNTRVENKNQRILMKNQIFGFEMPFDLISVAFASTVALGGVIGYVKASMSSVNIN